MRCSADPPPLSKGTAAREPVGKPPAARMARTRWAAAGLGESTSIGRTMWSDHNLRGAGGSPRRLGVVNIASMAAAASYGTEPMTSRFDPFREPRYRLTTRA